LTLERGQASASPGGSFRISLSDGGILKIPVPTYRFPDLKKISAGYHASDPLDLLDLFIGSEGTLGLITEVTIDTIPLPPAILTGLAFTADDRLAVQLAGELRRAALSCRAGKTADPDVRAIEWVDSRSLRLLKIHGDLRDLKLRLPPDAGSAVLFELELPARPGEEEVLQLLDRFLSNDPGLPDRAEVRLFRILDRCDVLESLLPALPGDRAGREQLRRFRESVPVRVNELLAAGRVNGAGPRKVGGDQIVPFHRLPGFVQAIEEEFGSRGLEFAIWGHLSDGNLHPNALPGDAGQVRLGEEALLALGDAAAAMGGCPLSEHGVGRSGLKQEMMRRFLGDRAVREMQAIKNALDPVWRFSPGTLFPRKDNHFPLYQQVPVPLE
jgi:D-lactate dehydrogenase (cytochrome)